MKIECIKCHVITINHPDSLNNWKCFCGNADFEVINGKLTAKQKEEIEGINIKIK